MRSNTRMWLALLCCMSVGANAQSVDYSQGVFIVNEDWYGHQNSTVNFLTNEGEWIYRCFQKENPGMELGCTNQYGTIYGDRFYMVAKQEQDPGSLVKGGRFTVCDANTMKCLKQIPLISVNESGSSNADGRSFLGVDEHKGYISTSNGIYVYDMDVMEIERQIAGTGNLEDEGYGSLYLGQVGTMVRVDDYVFAVHQNEGILVIDAKTDVVERVIGGPDGWGYGSVVLSKDGNLWASVANPTGNGQAAPFIMKIDPATCDTVRIDMPDGIYPPTNSWYAWTPDGFCASKQQNVLYWNGGPGSWFSNSQIFKYDIDRDEFEVLIDLEAEGLSWKLYGCSFRIHPVTDEVYISLYHTFSDPTFITRVYDNEGNVLHEYPMIENYWFPSLPVFPDNEPPVVHPMEEQVVDANGGKVEIPLKAIASDPDNMDAGIIKTLKNVSMPELLEAEVAGGSLWVTPKGEEGHADITIGLNSNGKLAETVVRVVVKNVDTGIKVASESTERIVYAKGNDIYVKGCEGMRFVLCSMDGKVVAAFGCASDEHCATVNVPSGYYILKAMNAYENLSFKLIIK